MADFNGLRCVSCNNELNLNVGYTGAEWDSQAGEGSGFGHEVSLNCISCARTYVIGFLRDENAISAPKDV